MAQREPISVARVKGSYEWVISYPTYTRQKGRVLTYTGELFIAWIPDVGCMPAIEETGTSRVYILDPRAVITSEGQVHYGPSSLPPDRLDVEMAEWIAEHPEWEKEWTSEPPPKIELRFPESGDDGESA